MPEVRRPDGAVISYKVTGSGYPLLLIAPGGVNSQMEFWKRSVVNPVEVFADEFMVIAMDQRQAGRSRTPLLPFSYKVCNGDQLAVLDDLGIERAHAMGGCIGCAHVFSLIDLAPGRITAAVCQDPVGLDESNSLQTFYRMFHPAMRLARAEGIEAVIRSAQENPLFVMNNEAGPFAAQVAADPATRDDLIEMGRERYVQLLVDFRDGMWPDNPPYFSVNADWMASCPAPLLILPGRDEFHPAGVSARICREAPDVRCLAPTCRDGDELAGTLDTIRQFLRDHARR